VIEVRVRKVSLAAYALLHGGELKAIESGEFLVVSPWQISELAMRYANSQEKRFDDLIIRLRDLKRENVGVSK
jgi:hypothetical protein